MNVALGLFRPAVGEGIANLLKKGTRKYYREMRRGRWRIKYGVHIITWEVLTDAVIASGPQKQVHATVDDQIETGAHGLDVLALVVLLNEIERDVRLAEHAIGVQVMDGDVQHGHHFG